jgi:hypothetical protein
LEEELSSVEKQVTINTIGADNNSEGWQNHPSELCIGRVLLKKKKAQE